MHFLFCLSPALASRYHSSTPNEGERRVTHSHSLSLFIHPFIYLSVLLFDARGFEATQRGCERGRRGRQIWPRGGQWRVKRVERGSRESRGRIKSRELSPGRFSARSRVLDSFRRLRLLTLHASEIFVVVTAAAVATATVGRATTAGDDAVAAGGNRPRPLPLPRSGGRDANNDDGNDDLQTAIGQIYRPSVRENGDGKAENDCRELHSFSRIAPSLFPPAALCSMASTASLVFRSYLFEPSYHSLRVIQSRSKVGHKQRTAFETTNL